MISLMHGMRRYIGNWRAIPRTERRGWLNSIVQGVKFYAAWRRCLCSSVAALNDYAPWITFEARDFVETLLKPGFAVFEYGSGGSTLFYSKRVELVVTVEHDLDWHANVVHALSTAGIRNCKCLIEPPEPANGLPGDPTDPTAYSSARDVHRNHRFRKYAASIDDFADGFFDFVSVDGRARPSCVWHAYTKVKIGGYLLLDNSERPHYHRAYEMLSDWEENHFYGPGPYGVRFWKTSLWRRTKV
jgi:hypothetical protein